MNYTKKRYLTYILITIFTIIIPFITINDNHLLLLSFDKLQFHFIGIVFNMNELYIMPFLLMFLFIGIFTITAILGRFWCGWACPQTIFRVIYRDLIESTILDLRRIKNKQTEINYNKKSNQIKKYISLILWGIICVIISINFMLYFVPPEDFIEYIKNPKEHFYLFMFIISISIFLFYDIIFMKENFCTYVCPYSRIQSVLYDDDTKQVVYNTNRGGNVYKNSQKSIFNVKEWNDNEECTTCESCVKVCPTNIDIRKGLQVECINCLECSDACSTVMGKLGRPSLITWGSTNSVLKKKTNSLFSNRNIIYFASLTLCIILAGFFGSKKEHFLVNINKTTNLYRVYENGVVRNNYIITIHNTSKKTYTYDVKLKDNQNFRIKRFNPKLLEASKRTKTVLLIETKRKLFLSDKKSSAIKIKVVVFAKEDKKIKLEREISFIYPRNDLVK